VHRTERLGDRPVVVQHPRRLTDHAVAGDPPQSPVDQVGGDLQLQCERGELAEAWMVFEELLATFPDYVATYLMAAYPTRPLPPSGSRTGWLSS
jgi:hypothetical protein